MSPPDLEALLVALVLAPATYSRNRFFELYTDPAVRRVRRRAALVRSIVRHVVSPEEGRRGTITRVVPAAGGFLELTYTVPALGLRRTTILDPLEAALVRFALGRGSKGEDGASPLLAPEEGDRSRIEAVLRRLAPPMHEASVSNVHEGGLPTGLPESRRPAMEQDPLT